MANRYHLSILNNGIDAWNKWRRDEPNILPDLTDSNLSGRDLSYGVFRLTNFRGANLDKTNFSQADLSKANFNVVDSDELNSRLRKQEELKQNENWWDNQAETYGESFAMDLEIKVDRDLEELRQAVQGRGSAKSLQQRFGTRTTLANSNLQRADLRGADLFGAELEGADLRFADLSETDLRGACLVNVHLDEANLNGATLDEVNLSGATVEGAHFGRGGGLSSEQISELRRRGAIFEDGLEEI